MLTKIETITLQIRELMVQVLIDSGLFDDTKPGLDVASHYYATHMAHAIMARLRIPAEILQENNVIATYPTTLWQHVRKCLGLDYDKTIVRMNEWLLYPNISASRPPCKDVRIWVSTDKFELKRGDNDE